VSFLEVEVEALTEQLPPPGPCAPPSGHNGVGAEDQGHHLHNTTRDLEQQLADKNRVSLYRDIQSIYRYSYRDI